MPMTVLGDNTPETRTWFPCRGSFFDDRDDYGLTRQTVLIEVEQEK